MSLPSLQATSLLPAAMNDVVVVVHGSQTSQDVLQNPFRLEQRNVAFGEVKEVLLEILEDQSPPLGDVVDEPSNVRTVPQEIINLQALLHALGDLTLQTVRYGVYFDTKCVSERKKMSETFSMRVETHPSYSSI